MADQLINETTFNITLLSPVLRNQNKFCEQITQIVGEVTFNRQKQMVPSTLVHPFQNIKREKQQQLLTTQ